jgi:lipopolysaccharide assembly outer membrane protein LptD (OstA)
LSRFALYEISHQGVEHILEGDEGKKFDAYYVITSAKFSDNTKKMIQSIRSDHAEYRAPLLDVKGDVRYLREDGLEFRTDAGRYNTKSGKVNVDGAFVITHSAHRIEGDRLRYHLNEDTLTAENVRGSYQLN